MNQTDYTEIMLFLAKLEDKIDRIAEMLGEEGESYVPNFKLEILPEDLSQNFLFEKDKEVMGE
jgi:hypothetical protein